MSGAARIALVTGGSAGIGAAIVARLLDDGFTVVSLARRTQPVGNPRLVPIEVDLADPVATRECARELARRYPATTIVHNAGAVREKPLEDATQEDLDALTHLHLSAPMALVQANLQTMRAAAYGRIVLVSTRAVLGLARRTVYASTKAGMLGMARTWALELAGDGITCNVVCPGPIADTDMFHEIIPRGSDKLAQVGRAVPVGRLGTPADVARSVRFFLEPEAGFVTGQTLFVCGGTSVGSITY